MNDYFPIQHDADKLTQSSRSVIDVSPDAIDVHTGEVRSSEASVNQRRIVTAIAVITMCFFALICRTLYLQVVRGDHYRSIAENNRLRTQVVTSVRGVIYDHENKQLVRNSPAFTLVVAPSNLPKDKAERMKVLDEIYTLTGISPTTIDLAIANQPDAYNDSIPIDAVLEYNDALAAYIEEENFPGVSIQLMTTRAYENTPLDSLSHVLGYTGFISPSEYEAERENGYQRTDKLGKNGIEASYEDVLRGVNGTRSSEVDAFGNEVMLIRKSEAVAGANLHLTIDYALTSYIESRLFDYMKTYGSYRASVVILDPRDGSVRALVSLPGYDNNLFAKGISESEYEGILSNMNNPLFPRATSGEFPPGSTIKPTIAAIALEDGIINQNTSFLSTGGISVSQWFFPDWKAGGHGVTNVRKAIAESVNTFFYIISGGLGDFTGLGIERITQEARRFGFGNKTGIDLQQEADGFLPTKEWKLEAKGEKWYIGDTYHAAIGQGDMLVTPLQTAVATSIFANGGTFFEPHLVDWIENGDKRIEFEPVVRSEQVVDSSNIDIVRQGMRQAVTNGSAQSLLSLREPVAGKTGTAQAGTGKENHAWFTSFGPYENPEIVVTVLVEEAGEGSAVAAPIARDIYEWWFANR